MKRILTIIISLLIIFLLFSLLGFYSAIRPFKITSSVTPKDYNIPYEDIRFKTTDNILVSGWFIKNPNPHAKTLILMHGYPADKGNILPITLFLHKKYHLLYFDFRYLGQSGGNYSSLGKNEINELLAAIRYLHTRNINEVGVWGFSLGGAVALMTAPLAPEIQAIVAESSYASLDSMVYDYYPIPFVKYPLGELTQLWAWLFLRIDIKTVSPVLAAKKIQIPVLLIHSKKDTVIPFKNALLLQKALSHNPHVKVIFMENGQHGEHFIHYDAFIEAFYHNYLDSR